MLDFVDSLSPGSGAVLVAALAAVITFIVGFFWRGKLAWLMVPVIPFIIAYGLYWFPVWWGGEDTSEYSLWAPLVIGLLFVPGMGGAWLALSLQRSLRNRRPPHD